MRVNLAIRGFANGQQQFEDVVDVDESTLDSLLPMLAEKHAAALISHELHMIEIEFLDEPDANGRYFRFGTDPRGMVMPIAFSLESLTSRPDRKDH